MCEQLKHSKAAPRIKWIAYEIYLFQKFKKIGYPFETYGLIGHLENRVKVIWQKELFSINSS